MSDSDDEAESGEPMSLVFHTIDTKELLVLFKLLLDLLEIAVVSWVEHTDLVAGFVEELEHSYAIPVVIIPCNNFSDIFRVVKIDRR